MTTFVVAFGTALLAALLFTPVVRAIAMHKGAVDITGLVSRKIHTRPVPRLGGVAVMAAFYLPLIGLLFYRRGEEHELLANPVLAYGVSLGGLVIGGLGVWDDIFGLGAKAKLTVQGLVAAMVVALGFRVASPDFFPSPLGNELVTHVASILWIIGVTNAFNLIDGLDGLASGIALTGLVPVVLFSALSGEATLGLACWSLAGALIGFLFYNFHPARIFLGDSGSMFVGFLLALVTVQSVQEGSAVVSLFGPILALGLPITDTILSILRRALAGRPICSGDADHIHHRLLRRGLGHSNAVLAMYGMATVLAIGSLILSFAQHYAVVVLVVAFLLVAALIWKLGYVPGRNESLALPVAAFLRAPHRRFHLSSLSDYERRMKL